MFEVFFVEAGRGVMKIAGAEHQLEQGVCILVEAGERHEITNTSSSDLVLNYFGVELDAWLRSERPRYSFASDSAGSLVACQATTCHLPSRFRKVPVFR